MNPNMTTAIVWAMLMAAQAYFGVVMHDPDLARPAAGYSNTDARMTVRLAAAAAAAGAAAAAAAAAPAGPAIVVLDGANYPANARDDDFSSSYYDFACALAANNFEKSAYHVLELCVANSVSTLDEKNIQSYFAMNGVNQELATQVLTRVINYLTSVIAPTTYPRVLTDRIERCVWLKYHTTYASGVGLVKKFLDATQNGAVFAVTVGTIAAVNAALAAPWDPVLADAVPLTLKGLAYIFLDAIKLLPTNKWYQGEKGAAMITPAATIAVRAWAVTTQAFAANTGAITAAANAAAADTALLAVRGIPQNI